MTTNKNYIILLKKFEEYRKANKMRKTPEREIILKEIIEKLIIQKPHFEADELFSSLITNKLRISRATVFRTLNIFVKANILRKSALGENHSHYEAIFDKDQHDHLICKSCGQIIEFSNKKIAKEIKNISELYNFEVFNHKFEIYGKCIKCAKKK